MKENGRPLALNFVFTVNPIIIIQLIVRALYSLNKKAVDNPTYASFVTKNKFAPLISYVDFPDYLPRLLQGRTIGQNLLMSVVFNPQPIRKIVPKRGKFEIPLPNPILFNEKFLGPLEVNQ